VEKNNELKSYSETQKQQSPTQSLSSLKLLSISKAASLLGIGKDTLHQLIADGKIGTLQIGKGDKIPVRELERFLDENLTYVNNEGKLIPSFKNDLPQELKEEFSSINIFNKIKGAQI
jgi:excisionase family DNA binding protein